MPYEKSANRPDIVVLLITVALVMIGLIMVYSAKLYVDQSYLQKQALRVAIGIAALLFGYFVPLGFWRRWPSVAALLLVIVVALALTLKFGPIINNARRQFLSVQFSELAKPAIVLFLACYYGMLGRSSGQGMGLKRFVLYPAAACAPAVILIAREPAISMALMIILLIATMFYLAEVKVRQILFLGVISGALIGVYFGAKTIIPAQRAYAERGMRNAECGMQNSKNQEPGTKNREGQGHQFRYIEERFRNYFSRTTHILDIRGELEAAAAPQAGPGHTRIDWQQDQSRIAIGSGGWLGLGLGNGKQKFAFLPMVATDFIFALIGEEWGFFGSFVIFVLFLLFLLRGMFLIRRAEDTFHRLLMSGVVIMIVGTALIHLFVALRLIPPTGQTLPFVSYGASAMAASMFGVGLLLQSSKHILRRPIENDLVSRGWNWWARVSGSRTR